MNKLEKIAEEIRQRNNFVILGHVDPDGDCIGSVVGMQLILEQLSKNSRGVLHDFSFAKFGFLFSFLKEEDGSPQDDISDENDYNQKQLFKSSSRFFRFSDLKEGDPVNVDDRLTVIALDSGDLERLGDEGQTIAEDSFVINLDHHPDNPAFGDLNFVKSEAAAVGEIIYDLAGCLEVEIDIKMGTALATALISDTGSLRYKNTSARILKIVSELMDQGVEIYRINNYLYGNHKFNTVKLKGLALSNLQLTAENRIAWIYVDRQMLSQTDTQEEDASGLVNYARDIQGVKVGIAFIETEDGEIKVSFRSQSDRIPVNEVAAVFDGGGHARAAGCSLQIDGKQAIEKVLSEVRKFV